MPLDLLVYEADTLRVTKFVHIDGSNQYMAMIRDTWGSRLKQVFAEIPDPTWFDSYVPPGVPRLQTRLGQPVRAPTPPFVEAEPASPMQLVAGQVKQESRTLIARRICSALLRVPAAVDVPCRATNLISRRRT